MARRIRVGLDYFPLDTSWDLNIRLLKVQYGLEGLGTAIQLFQMIYREGYSLKWNSETKQLFCSENHIDEKKLDDILEFCIDHGLFDRGIFERYSVLTSRSIQRQWIRICTDAKRKNMYIEPSLNLCPENEEEQEKQNQGKTPKIEGNTREFSGKMRELSEEIKEKKNKEKKSIPEEFSKQSGKSEKEIPPFIQDLAEQKRALSEEKYGNNEPISSRFLKFIEKTKQS